MPEIKRDKTQISIAGTPLTEDQVKLVKLVTLDSSLYVPDMCEILIAELKDTELPTQPYKVGDPLKVSLTDPNDSLTVIFEGEITAVEPIFETSYVSMVIRGYDKSHRMHRGTKTKAWLNTKDSDIASAIASANGLSTQIDATSETYKHVFQHAQSDFEFLQSRADRIGYTVFTENGKLKFLKPEAPSSADITLEFRKNLIAFRPRMSLSEQVTEVKVRGFDPKTKKEIIGTASSSNVGAKAGVGKTGTQATQSAFGDAKRLFVRDNLASQADATKVAEALLNQANEHFIEADGEAEGLPTMHAGMVVEIKGVGDKFGGKFRLTSVRHEYRKGVYQSFFKIEGRKPQLLSDMFSGSGKAGENGGGWHGVVTAIVTNNNSTEGDYGMVKLKYPWLDSDNESFWARVAFPGGGKERGLYIMPEVDDEVLVAFEQGNFDRPYVLGGLHNGKDAPPTAIGQTVTGGLTYARTLKSRTGHTITLYDDNAGQEYIEIKDAKANTQIKFDTTNKKITLESKGEIEIKGQSNISMKSTTGNITIEASAGNVNIKGIQFVAEGSSSADLKSNGQTNVQGTMTNVKSTSMGELSANGILTIRGSLVKIN